MHECTTSCDGWQYFGVAIARRGIEIITPCRTRNDATLSAAPHNDVFFCAEIKDINFKKKLGKKTGVN